MSDRLAHLEGRTLRAHAARGVLISTGFTIGASVVGLLRGFALAAFLTATDYGVWGTVLVLLSLLLVIKQVGIGDKYIQQDSGDQELAFQQAFTLEAMSSAAALLIAVVAAPLIALAYDDHRLLWATLAFAAVLPATPLQMPIAIFYRTMQYGRQAALQAIEPVVATIVALALAIAGAGYWALFAGLVAGGWATAAAAVAVSPYRLRFRYDPRVLREYWDFSWPLFLSAASGVIIAAAALIAANVHLGLVGAGVLTLGANISFFTARVDQVITNALYPAICAAADRVETLRESFLKTNRLALMWAMPFGFGLTLFADDLVEFVIGRERWAPAVILLQIYGAVAALNQIGFNWDAYYRARADTRPLAITNGATMISFLLTAIPLLFVDGLRGFGIGVGIQVLVNLAFRAHYLARLFGGFSFLGHLVRAMLPIVPAVLVVVVLRAAGPDDRTAELAAAELALYAGLCVLGTWLLERPLLREALGYVRPSLR